MMKNKEFKKKMSISDDIDENNIYEDNLNLQNKNSEIEEKSSVYNQEMMSENNNSNVLYDSNKSMTKISKIEDKINDFKNDINNSSEFEKSVSFLEESENSIISRKKSPKKEEIPDLIVESFLQIKECPILKYGIKPSSEPIKYGFCSTCDINLIHPICIFCIEKCHKKYNHQIRIKTEPEKIICGCGERLHKFPLKDKKTEYKTDKDCPYTDWCDKTGLNHLYVVDDICVCEFCYKLCGLEGMGVPLEIEKEMLQICECEELNNGYSHIDLKQIYRKFENLIKSSKYYIMDKIEPLIFFNILFLGKHSYQFLFFNFEEVINEFNHLDENSKYEIKENFLVTNFFLSLKNFNLVASKIKKIPLRYYCPQASNKITFKTVYNIFKYIKYRDNTLNWIFYEHILFFYRKVYLGEKTNKMDKYKLYDLENFSPIQRKCIFDINKSFYPESKEHINFLIEYCSFLLNSEITCIDAYNAIIEFCGIFKRMAVFFLFNSAEMTRLCFSLEKGFEFFKKSKSNYQQIKLYLIIIKMMHYFIYSYNDEIFFQFLLSERKSRDPNITFLFEINELGRLICKNVIRISYSILLLQNVNENNDRVDQNKCTKIMNHAMKILTFLISPKDNFNISLSKFRNNCNNYLNILKISYENDNLFKQIIEHTNFIENNYEKYYSIEIENNELINEISKSLEGILSLAKNSEIKPYLLRSHYYYAISKIFYIAKFDDTNQEHKDFISNYFLFLRYFIENNNDNCFIIFSHFILNAIFRIPKSFCLDILRIIEYASDIICKKDTIILNSKHILKTLYNYFNLFKDCFKVKEIKSESINSNLSDNNFNDDFLHLILMITCKLVIITTHQNPKLIKKVCRDYLSNLINTINFSTISSDNLCLILVFINKIFDSSDGKDRKNLIELINVNILLKDLNDLSIDLDYRTEILRFLKKYKFTIFFKEISSIPTNVTQGSQFLIEDSPRKKRTKTIKRKSLRVQGGISTDLNLIKIFINGEEQEHTNYEYINSFAQNEDNYTHIKNNPLISNYKFPTRSLTFFYYLNQKDYIDDEENLSDLEEGIRIWEAEISKVKDLYEKNSNHLLKFFRYCVKGIFIPLGCILKTIFTYSHNCGGNKILLIYQVLMKLLYIKNFLIEIKTYLYSEKNVNFINFKLQEFLSDESQKETLEDFFNLKEGKKFSPFDYTQLYDILNNHILKYINYPTSLNMIENFGYNELEHFSFYNVQNEIELLSVPCQINRKKRAGLFSNLRKKNNFSIIPNNQTFFHQNTDNPLLTNEKQSNFIYDDSENEKLESIFKEYDKAKKNINKSYSLVSTLNEICNEYEVNYRRLFLCILIYLSSKEEEYQIECFLILYKLLKIENYETQDAIMDNLGGKSSKELGFISNLSNQLYIIIVKLFISDFNIDYENYRTHQILIFNIMRIFKTLCENHFTFFQNIFFKELEFSFVRNLNCKMNITMKTKFLSKDENKSENNKLNEVMSFSNFLISILHKIMIITNKAKDEAHIQYYFDTEFCIIELLIELIQGNKEEILIVSKDKTKKDEFTNSCTAFIFHNFVQVVTDILFDDSMILKYAFKTRLILMTFFISILEQKKNEEIQKIIMKFLTINRVLSSIIFTLKTLFYKQTKNNPKYSEYYSNFTDKQIEQNLFVFDYTIYDFYKHEYFHDESIKNSDEFNLANHYFRYIKLLSIKKISPEAVEIIKQAEKITESESRRKFGIFSKNVKNNNEVAPINLINEKERSINMDFIEHFFCIKFFEIITKVVEVRLPLEKRNQKVIFTVPREIIYLSDMTKDEFLSLVDRTNETTKKSELIKNIIVFKEEIKYFKNSNISCFSKFLLNLDYIYVQTIVYLFAVFFLIFMLFTLKGYTETNPISGLRNLIPIQQKFLDSIDNSIKDWGNIYDVLIYCYTALNGILIISWIIVKLPLYYSLDKVKYCEQYKIPRDNLTLLNKFYIITVESIYGRDYINSLIYVFLLSFIGSVMKRGEIVYAFFLLAIVNLNPTLKGIALSIKVQRAELGASFLLMIALVYFYSNIGFFFFNENFEREIENGHPDNFCSSLIFCFLTNVDAGIRARGGAADQMVRISYERNTKNYITRVIYDVTYFLICIIIMIDLVFGIILGTFAEMREKERVKTMDKYNHCFICHNTKNGVEKKDEDFNRHREIRHNLWNYVNYMLFLKLTPIEDLNAINSYARESLDDKNIIFLPSCKDDFDNENGIELNEEEKIEEEEEEVEEESDEFDDKDEDFEDEEFLNGSESKKDDFDKLLDEEEEKKNEKSNNEKNSEKNNIKSHRHSRREDKKDDKKDEKKEEKKDDKK